MKAASPRVLCLLLLLLLACAGCAGGISVEDHDAALADLAAAQADATAAEAEVDALRSQVEALTAERDEALSDVASLEMQRGEMTCGESAQDAWDAVWARHERIRVDVPERGALLDLAPWMIFPEPPSWLDACTLCSIQLKPDLDGEERVCIIESPEGDMLVSIKDAEGLISMSCRGGGADYDMTVTNAGDRRIVQQMMMVDEDYAQLEWVGPEGMERFVAIYNGIEYTSYWPANKLEYDKVYESFVQWNRDVGNEGGLIRDEDRPLMMIGLGNLRGLPYAGLTLTDAEALKMAIADLVFGVPTGSLQLRSAT
ncbi:MAG: hypothetical protein JW846_01200 [Dehalococcoidia bacterium]|nr:hypothetical protein [Dehalococcoidia bacterium]